MVWTQAKAVAVLAVVGSGAHGLLLQPEPESSGVDPGFYDTWRHLTNQFASYRRACRFWGWCWIFWQDGHLMKRAILHSDKWIFRKISDWKCHRWRQYASHTDRQPELFIFSPGIRNQNPQRTPSVSTLPPSNVFVLQIGPADRTAAAAAASSS